jgi:tripeptide aminopeptidase
VYLKSFRKTQLVSMLGTFGCEYAYTVDGSTVGQIENETFCADHATVTFAGINAHPGTAKNRLVNALKVAARFVAALPHGLSPEATCDRQGFVHPIAIEGGVEQTTVSLILRDFDEEPLRDQAALLERLASEATRAYPGSTATLKIVPSYRNMRIVLDQYPKAVAYALEATRRAGIEPVLQPIRGGTDGALLSFRGLPTPNIFTGGHLYHSRLEWIAVEGMQATVDTLIHLVQVWAEPFLRT